ncbi:MAG TPA: hypothetical protein VEW93_09390 [Acidimicrobiales bacterium]|nr:hypothetical protein [Acidimicrobiales bacterium]
MSGLDSIPLDSSGYLDMDGFPDDGSVLADDALADLHQALLADPVDEPADEDWSSLVAGALDDAEPADGPFAVGDDDPVAGVRHEDAPTDDDPDGTEGGEIDVADSDGPEGGEADDTGTDLPDDDGTGPDLDLDGDLGAEDLVGLDLLDPDDEAVGVDALAHVEEAEAPAEAGPGFEDYL